MPSLRQALQWQTVTPRWTRIPHITPTLSLHCQRRLQARPSLPLLSLLGTSLPPTELQMKPWRSVSVSCPRSASTTSPPSAPSWSTWWPACLRGENYQISPTWLRGLMLSAVRGYAKSVGRNRTPDSLLRVQAWAHGQEPDVHTSLSSGVLVMEGCGGRAMARFSHGSSVPNKWFWLAQ